LRRDFGLPRITTITYQYDNFGRPTPATDDFAIASADVVVEHSENFSPELPDQWPTPYLTKSRYLAGLQCGRRL
jgi:hypothetical protein